MRIVFIISLCFISLLACKSQRYTINDLPNAQLIFGKGGGITGAVSTYTILENGQVFYNNSFTKENKEINSLSKKKTTSYFQKMKALQLSKVNFDHPGNIYYFLEEVNGDERHRITWGSNEHDISATYEAFYKELRTTIK